MPDTSLITEENADGVISQLEEIDEAKLKLSDEEYERLYFAKYDGAVRALEKLYGEEGASTPSRLGIPTSYKKYYTQFRIDTPNMSNHTGTSDCRR